MKASTVIQEAERVYQKAMIEYKFKLEEWMIDHESSLEGLEVFEEHRGQVLQSIFYKFSESMEINLKIHQKVTLFPISYLALEL